MNHTSLPIHDHSFATAHAKVSQILIKTFPMWTYNEYLKSP